MKKQNHPLLRVCLTLVVALAVNTAAMAAVPVEILAPTSVPHHGAGFAVVDGKLHLWTGYTSISSVPDRTAEHEIYDPLINSWSVAADYPVLRNSPGSFALNGQLYSLGGEGSFSGNFNNDFRRYSPITNAWTQLPNGPRDTWDVLTGVVDGRAFFFSGRSEYGATHDDVWELDTTTNTWQSRSPITTSVLNAGVAAHDGKLYVFGGDHKTGEANDEYIDTIQVYDPVADSWSVAGSMPVTLNLIQAVPYAGKIFVFSAFVLDEFDNSSINNQLYRYDPALGTWDSFEIDYPNDTQLRNHVLEVDGYAYFLADDRVSMGTYRINLATVPEPASVALLAICTLGLIRRRLAA